ncbi:DNA primase [Marivivens aquimaris]|uniref:DNA primase n=1 Tax=Marivivens aquimaris TaxID=2774876 RepID=UPI0018802831|nr:DNA primase [Marivivens aquimaris]
MSLPPGFLDELRTRLSLAQVVGRKVMWDQRKSNQGKGDWWAPCPFHQEKSASFHVDDRKGYYYCFGCQAKGDAISFVQESENVGFMEAIKILAAEAGMPMPERDPQAQAKTDHRTKLAEVMEEAVKFFRLQLKTQAAGEARAYLARRGLQPQAIDRWEIGFAPQGWQNLYEAMTAKGIPDDLLLAAGLCKKSDKNDRRYDIFRDRIMFPIRDGRGRAIAFGGRAMDPNDNAKYLNSPETDLFDKGRNLFNVRNAREAAGKGQPLIVAEGYMDVIALSEAGFGAAVAPLGTAVTDSQLQMMWRISPEPVIALDGDKAGLRAAMRVIDLVLPMLEAGKSLRFALFPDGMDPDDLIRAKGASAVQEVLDAAMPTVRLMWQRETEGKVFDSPERRAALDKVLREKIKLIRDPSLRRHYGDAIAELRADLFQTRRNDTPRFDAGGGGQRRQWQPRGKFAPSMATAGTKASELATGTADENLMRETVILAIFVANLDQVEAFEERLERMECYNPENGRLRDALLRTIGEHEPKSVLEEQIGIHALENLMGQRHIAITPAIRRNGDRDLVRNSLIEEMDKLFARRGHEIEMAEAVEEFAAIEEGDEGVTWRIGKAALAVDPTTRREVEDTTEVVIADNGLALSKDERDMFRKLIETLGTGSEGKKSSN